MDTLQKNVCVDQKMFFLTSHPALAPDVQVQSEHCLGLQARTKQFQPRLDSIRQEDIQAQTGHPSADQTYCHVRSDQLRQSDRTSEVRLASHSPSADIQVQIGRSSSGRIVLLTWRHRAHHLRPDNIQTQAGHPSSGWKLSGCTISHQRIADQTLQFRPDRFRLDGHPGSDWRGTAPDQTSKVRLDTSTQPKHSSSDCADTAMVRQTQP